METGMGMGMGMPVIVRLQRITVEAAVVRGAGGCWSGGKGGGSSCGSSRRSIISSGVIGSIISSSVIISSVVSLALVAFASTSSSSSRLQAVVSTIARRSLTLSFSPTLHFPSNSTHRAEHIPCMCSGVVTDLGVGHSLSRGQLDLVSTAASPIRPDV